MNSIQQVIANKFGSEKYSFLKLLEIVYDKSFHTCTISFLYPETLSSFTKDDKQQIAEFLTDWLNLNAKVIVKFNKSYLDEHLICNSVLSFFKENRRSLASVINLDNIKVKVANDDVMVNVGLPQQILQTLKTSELIQEIIIHLNNFFIANFAVDFSGVENLNTAKIQESIAKDLNTRIQVKKAVARYKVFDVYKLVGKDITPEPEFLSSIKTSKPSVILAGTIQNFAKKTYKRTRNGKEVEKTYYKFTLHEDNRYISMVYFCPKANIIKMDKLVDGTEVLVIADIKKEHNSLSGYIKDLSLCQINQVVRNHSKEKITSYKTVFPQKYEIFSQSNIFDKEIKYNANIANNTFVVFDVETTGLDAENCEIIEIGAVKVSGGRIIEKFQTLVKPKQQISTLITDLTGIDNQMVESAPKIETVIKDFYLFTKNTILAGYNVNFDMKFIQNSARKEGLKFENEVQDVMVLARQKVVSSNYKLSTIVKTLNLSLENAHRAFFDALATAEVMLTLSKEETA